MNVTENGGKHSMIWVMFMAVTMESGGWERITWTIVCPLWTRQISHSNKCSTYLRNWCLSKMRSQDWKQLVGRIIHGNICHLLVTKESSIFSARRSTSFRILCCVLVRYTRTPNRTMHGKTDWDGSNHLRNTETFTESTVSRWTSSGIFSQDSIRRSSVKKSKVYCTDWEKHHKISQEEFYLCRCSTTFPVEQKTMKKNFWQMLDSYLSMQEDLEKDNGHSLVLVLRKSGTLSKKTVHKESGTKLQKGCCWNSLRADGPIFRATTPLSRGQLKKQRSW